MEQLVILALLGLISLIHWLFQKSVEKRAERQRLDRLDQGIEEPPAPRVIPASDSEESMRRLREALGLPDTTPRVELPRPVAPTPPPLPTYPLSPPPVPVTAPAFVAPNFPSLTQLAAEMDASRRHIVKRPPILLETAPAVPARRIRELLAAPHVLRDGIILAEILGAPKALRD